MKCTFKSQTVKPTGLDNRDGKLVACELSQAKSITFG